MNTTKRIFGDYIVNTVDSVGDISNEVTFNTLKVNINGDLDVFGTVNKITETELEVVDKSITLNTGEAGDGITGGAGDKHSGIIVDRGNYDDVGLRYNEEEGSYIGHGIWELTQDGTTWYPILTDLDLDDFLKNVVEDETPQLGGDLDVNGFTITSASNGDVVIDAHGTGQVKVDHVLSLEDQILTPAPVTGYNKLYAKTPSAGGSGLFVSNDDVEDELVSKTKAVIYSIIF
jgi:hypothetical protein